MHAPLPCVSIACLLFMRLHDLKAYLYILLLVLDLLWCECFPWAFVLYVLLPSWVGPYLIVAYSFSNPSFAPFVGLLALLPCHFVIPIMLLYDPCLLGSFWACYILSLCLIPEAQYYHWASIHIILDFLDPFHCFWASLAHLILLGILNPFPFLRYPQPILLPWAFAKSFGLSQPKLPYPLLLEFMGFPSTPYLLNSLLRTSLAYSCLLSISYNVLGFTTFFLWAPLDPLAFFEAHLLFSRPMIYYSCHLGLMVFFFSLSIY